MSETASGGPRFAMADEQWQGLKAKFGMTDRQVVDMFLKPFLTEVAGRGEVAFAQDPRQLPERSLLGEQWRILRDDLGFVYDASTGRAVPLTREAVEGLL